jgi:hypothetical protein
LLSPQTSPIGGIGSPSGRVVLIGSRNPHAWPSFYKDTDPIILSEIAEFAFSLKCVTKGQEPFHGLPHLQAYKLIRASYLAEIGEIQAASRWVVLLVQFCTFLIELQILRGNYGCNGASITLSQFRLYRAAERVSGSLGRYSTNGKERILDRREGEQT